MKLLATSTYHNPAIYTSCESLKNIIFHDHKEDIYHSLHQLCFLYILNYPVMYTLSERAAVNMLGIMFTFQD